MDEKFIEYLVGGKRFSEFKGYRFDKLIFGSYVLLILVLFLTIFFVSGSDKTEHIYYKCDAGFGQCISPFYHNYPLCEKLWFNACQQEFIEDGFSFGDPVPFVVRSWGLILGVLLFGAFVLNHFMHNRDFKFKRTDIDER